MHSVVSYDDDDDDDDADLPAVVRGSFIKTQIRYSRVSVALSPLSVAGAVNHGHYDIREATHHCLTNYHSTTALTCWRFGVAVTRWSRSTQLLYIEPG